MMGLYWRVWGYVRRSTHLIIAAVLLSLLLSLSGSLAIYSFLPVFDIVLGSVPNESPVSPGLVANINEQLHRSFEAIAGQGSTLTQLVRLVAFIAVLQLVSTTLGLFVDYLFILVQARGTRELRRETFDHLNDLPLTFYNQLKAGTLISRVTNDIGGAIGLVTNSIAEVVKHAILALTLLGLLLAIDMTLTLRLLPIVALIGMGIWLLGSWVKRVRLKILALQADITAILHEFISGIKVIKSLGGEEFERRRWRQWIERWRELEVISVITKAVPVRGLEVGAVLILAALLIVGGQAVARGRVGSSELLVYFLLIGRFLIPAAALARVWVEIQAGIAHAERAFALLDEPPAISSGKLQAAAPRKEIAFDRVSFGHEQARILDQVSFRVPVGTMLAIVGTSGAGKTTLIDVLLRFYAPQAGHITFDGQDVTEFNLKGYRALFGVVGQETFLFHDTVHNNLIYGLPQPPDPAAIKTVIEGAQASEFIADLPQSLASVIGDRGVRLSAGQRQRLAIARALVRNPAILVFDEATSALDSQTEKDIQQALTRARQGRTTFVIAHRLASVVEADQIIVLHEGRIVEQGRHPELLKTDGLYRHLWRLQTTVV